MSGKAQLNQRSNGVVVVNRCWGAAIRRPSNLPLKGLVSGQYLSSTRYRQHKVWKEANALRDTRCLGPTRPSRYPLGPRWRMPHNVPAAYGGLVNGQVWSSWDASLRQ
eukprot:289287-Pelagomonas_calceolata.AAC.1